MVFDRFLLIMLFVDYNIDTARPNKLLLFKEIVIITPEKANDR
jgi:hypothetical protein